MRAVLLALILTTKCSLKPHQSVLNHLFHSGLLLVIKFVISLEQHFGNIKSECQLAVVGVRKQFRPPDYLKLSSCSPFAMTDNHLCFILADTLAVLPLALSLAASNASLAFCGSLLSATSLSPR